uniref:Uncharacterized protein n=1 Tax=Lepeophtheirus salmonis TaxID=72036 RepID=A0A0K2THT0_LEPSM
MVSEFLNGLSCASYGFSQNCVVYITI